MKFMKHAGAAVLLSGWLAGTAGADVADTGRELLRRNQDAVVSVKLVIKSAMAFSGRNTSKNESKSEVTGTVISPDGLTVISLSATDPAGTMQKIFKSAGGGDDAKMKWDSELSDVKILHANGKELAARVLLRDADLDLVFIEPTERTATPFAFVDLSDSAEAQILDEVLVIGRMGTVGSRSSSAALGRISARVDKPRTFYAVGEGAASGLGLPVFTLAGKVLGLVLLRAVDTGGGFGFESMISSPNNLGIMPVVIPAADIRESAEQAVSRQAEADEPAPEPEAEPAAP
jgi:hypothetical protein